MYEVMSIGSIDIEVASQELRLDPAHVKAYFENYELYKKYPIRDLTFEETQLVKSITEVKLMTDKQLKEVIEDNDIDLEEMKNDQLLIERKLSRYNDEHNYSITRKYQHFILEPAILHGNMEAPLTKPLDMNDVMTLLSNIAAGLSNQVIGTTDGTKIKALSKIADIYTTSKMLNMGGGNRTYIDSTDLEDLSPTELTKIIDFVKTTDNVPEQEEETLIKQKHLKKEALVEFIIFD